MVTMDARDWDKTGAPDWDKMAAAVASRLNQLTDYAWAPAADGETGVWRVGVTSGDGLRIGIGPGKDPARVHARALYGITAQQPRRFEISVALDRGPELLASDIRRRILQAGYPAEAERLAADEARREREHRGRELLMTRARGMFGRGPDPLGVPRAPGSRGDTAETRFELRTRITDRRAMTPHVMVSARGDGQAMDLEVTGIPQDIVMRMLQVLSGHEMAVAH